VAASIDAPRRLCNMHGPSQTLRPAAGRLHSPIPEENAMSRPTTASCIARQRQRLLGAAALWLFIGAALLASRLVPMYSALLGWSAAFWLLGAPLLMLLALEPGLPRQVLSLRFARRRARDVVWN
jgi:hypothetical protein